MTTTEELIKKIEKSGLQVSFMESVNLVWIDDNPFLDSDQIRDDALDGCCTMLYIEDLPRKIALKEAMESALSKTLKTKSSAQKLRVFRCTTVYDCCGAIKYLERNDKKPDIVILDLKLQYSAYGESPPIEISKKIDMQEPIAYGKFLLDKLLQRKLENNLTDFLLVIFSANPTSFDHLKKECSSFPNILFVSKHNSEAMGELTEVFRTMWNRKDEHTK